MIEEKFVGDLQSTRFAAIEAFVEVKGWVNSNDLTKLFGMHRCNAAKIINKYILYVNEHIHYASSDKRYVKSSEYERKVLLTDTNATGYLRALQAVHGLNYDI